MPGLPVSRYTNIVHRIVVRQMPTEARACSKNLKERRALTPMPAVELRLFDTAYGDTRRVPLTPGELIPYVLHAGLVDAITLQEIECISHDSTPALRGTYVSSAFFAPLDRDKSGKPTQTAVFVFPDLGVRAIGDRPVRLHFSLLRLDAMGHQLCAEEYSPEFRVFSSVAYSGVQNATPLTRILNQYTVRVRTRNHPSARRVTRNRLPRSPSTSSSRTARSRATSAASASFSPASESTIVSSCSASPDSFKEESDSPQLLAPPPLLQLPLRTPQPIRALGPSTFRSTTSSGHSTHSLAHASR
ncbi:velvet factor-domain-containing protein [Mycena amicta]|nr:velvet factor-domain-containing protein [Mycena amicta]